jgi:hypothetical protein
MGLPQAEFLTLTTEWYRTFLRKPEEDIGGVVFSEVMRCASELLSFSFTTEELANENGQQLIFELFYLYAHLLNRTAFRLFGNEFRCELQDKLVDTSFHAFIKSVFPEASAQGREGIYEMFLAEMNETEVLYGHKPRVVDKDYEFSDEADEAVLTTFSKRVSVLLGHQNNPVTMLKVQIVLIDSIARASLDEMVTRAKEKA